MLVETPFRIVICVGVKAVFIDSNLTADGFNFGNTKPRYK